MGMAQKEWARAYKASTNPAEMVAKKSGPGHSVFYDGGLLRAPVRYFDQQRGRPGLPPGVAAFVDELKADEAGMNLVNTGTTDTQTRHRLRRLVRRAQLHRGQAPRDRPVHAQYQGGDEGDRKSQRQVLRGSAPAGQRHTSPGGHEALREQAVLRVPVAWGEDTDTVPAMRSWGRMSSLDWPKTDRRIMGESWVGSRLSEYLVELTDGMGPRWAGTDGDARAAR